MYTHLDVFISKVWDGDMSFKDATEGFTATEIKAMDQFIHDHSILFRDGMPNSYELPDWVREHQAGKLVIKLVSNWEEDV